MQTVINNLKRYENIIIEHNPYISQMKDTVSIVKEFIRKRNLLLYGGTAIDYALRLKGDCIYPDESLEVPDLDFYSPNHVEDAYDLTDILYQLGYKETNAFRAFYVLAMRVDVGGNNIVADIGYIQPDIFEHVPYIEYEGMRVIHPNYQMISTHSSLSFPFDNAPAEVVFNRWKKDITRHNLLYSYYPLPQSKREDTLAQNTIAIHRRFIVNVFMGFAAYAILYQHLKVLLGDTKLNINGVKMPKDVIAAEFQIKPEYIQIGTVGSEMHFIHLDTDAFAEKYLQNTKVSEYKPYKDIIPQHIEAVMRDEVEDSDVNLHVHWTENRLVGIAAVEIDGCKLRMVSAQHILMFMIIRYNVLSGKQATTAAAYYLSTLKIIKTAEQLMQNATKDEQNEFMLSEPFFPSIKTYGGGNYSDSVDNIKRRADERILKIPAPPTPTRYEPASGKKRPVFDYAASKYFDRGGECMDKHSGKSDGKRSGKHRGKRSGKHAN